MININNIFDFCIENNYDDNVYYYIDSKLYGNSISIIGINSYGKIMSLSDEWLSLIKVYYNINNPHIMYHNTINMYNYINNNKNKCLYYDELVIPLITSFSTGTVHGYTGIYSILIEYINNYEKYKNYKLLVYKNSQKGILDIINKLCNLNIIDKNNIIYLDGDIIYKFKSLLIIPNICHVFTNPLSINTNNFIEKYLLNNIYPKYKQICLLKTTNTNNITNVGVINNKHSKYLCDKYNLNFLNTNIIDEIELLNTINNCEIFVTSWGSAFLKNYIYISNNCKKIIVLVIDQEFIKQYNNNKNLIKKFKNAIIEYVLCENSNNIVNINLNINLNI